MLLEILLEKITYQNSTLNAYRFVFFGFSKLYSIVGIETLFKFYLDASEGSSTGLNGMYEEFFRNFPGDLLLGDIQNLKVSDPSIGLSIYGYFQ